jgi:2-keto-3-deoxy-L-rhamnonate aldolase RhmA
LNPETTPSLRLARRLREALLGRRPLLGTFVKGPPSQSVELLAGMGLDLLVIDLEHAPIDRSDLDRAALASIAADLPIVARLPADSHHLIGAALDMGVAGVMLAHVRGVADAERLVGLARFQKGTRGASPGVRAAGYGSLSLQAFMAASDAAVTLWAQIEDPAAVESADAIAAVSGLDALFVGRVDLCAALGVDSVRHPMISAATRRVAAAACGARLSAAAQASTAEDASELRAAGANVLLLGTDHGALRDGIRSFVAGVRQPDANA